MTVGAQAGRRLRLDPSVFEIVRHRLWYINDEGALTISRLSGSPVATEVFDMNTGLMTANGDLVYIDNFICAQATTLSAHVKHLLESYADNPGFADGDVFLCNDPYVSVCHQNCVQVVAPIFYEGDLVAWAGASLHAIDVGGPTAGQVQPDAADIYGEQPLIGPIKVYEGGRFRRDVENTYLNNSRLPELLGLDLRAKVAAVQVIRTRLVETLREFGAETVLAAMEDVIDYTEWRLRARLAELPDGTWRHRAYIEFGDDIYDCHVTMRKEGEHLAFDFTETADQAPAVINCARPALHGGVLAAVLVYLCWDIPWSPAGVRRALTIESREGSVVDAARPAGVSKSTTTSIWEVRNLASITCGKMLAASDLHRHRAMAGWQGVKALEELFGYEADGERFGGPLLDGMAGGGGALATRDGIDTGGHTSSLRATIANVESYELRYPILYLYRRQTRDSGGPGKYRGGAGPSMMYIVHGVEEIPTKILHTFGVEQPESPGLCGGYPSTTNQFAIVRGSDVRARLARGEVPQELDDLDGTLEVFGAFAATSMRSDDVYRVVSMGGGGYGDPLERDPALVARDVGAFLVSREWAERVWGVVLAPGTLEVDLAATARRRADLRHERATAAGLPNPAEAAVPPRSAGGGLPGDSGGSGDAVAGERLSELLFRGHSGSSGEGAVYRCRCGHVLGAAERPYKELAAQARFPVQRIGPEVNPHKINGARFELREFYCPGCLALLEIEIARPGDPVLDDARLALDDARQGENRT
ncbi:hydantoinase B/oxoprolinase family protein [Actinomadura sp. KC06]|uniref:hydantoinase B/oxoprolinase family protein n=1 Tax=Actinomadura sp. KC06 TaxID=2530369 RepID=UPI0010460927|nr:hydantoinase B/oxoprolinase family protein [Actinomadura sp. KC06]TDD33878.1 hydantoinase B/oxoprolinase family protein [Actinomadura sp. KC06]